ARGAREEGHRVEAAHERGRAAGRAGGDELLLDEEHAAGLLARQVKGEARAVDAAADDHEVRGPRQRPALTHRSGSGGRAPSARRSPCPPSRAGWTAWGCRTSSPSA